MEGIEEALYWHTVGIVADSGRSTGTAIATRFNRQCALLTAKHVIDKTSNESLGFFFRPPGTLKREDWWQGTSPAGRIEPARPIQIFHRFLHPNLDLAALVVSPTLNKHANLKFFDLSRESKLPRPMSSVAVIGFPADSLQLIRPGIPVIAAYTIWGNVERGKHWRPSDYQPSSNLLLRFLPATIGKHPGGFSGAGVWYHGIDPKGTVWSPNLGLAGIVTHYYPGKQMLLISRVEGLAQFLGQICPA